MVRLTTRTFRVNRWFKRQHLATIGFILAMLAIGLIQYQTVQTAARIKSEARARAVALENEATTRATALENEATARAKALENEQVARTTFLCQSQKELRQDIEDRDAKQAENLIREFELDPDEAEGLKIALLEDLPDLTSELTCPTPPK